MEERARLGAMLVREKLLTNEQLKMAIDFQKEVGGKLGAIIVKLGFIEDHTLVNFIARQQGLQVVDLAELVLPENLVHKIPRKLIEKHNVIPIEYRHHMLTIATSDPFDYEAIEELQLALTDTKIEMKLASRSAILKCIKELFYREGAAESPVREKSKDELLRELEDEGKPAADRMSPMQLREALIPLLIEKGIITREELARKAREIEAAREKETAR
ncbi:MAG: hypothetical protein HYY17_11380 [Planctomycetes bacterium]|nr:hypothetical protein [Planctomycetota bacterium]